MSIMVKDRLQELRNVQVPESQPRSQPVKFDDSQHPDVMKVRDLQHFHKEVEEMNSMLESVAQLVSEVKNLHHSILASPFSKEDERRRLDDMTQNIKEHSKRLQGKLKLLDRQIEKLDTEGLENSSLCRIRRVQHSTLTRRFMDIMTDYNNIQTAYRENCKKRIKRQLEITGNVTTDDQLEEMLESGNTRVFTEGIVVETQKAKQTLEDIEARHKDILLLEQSIMELHDMFMDMAMIVENQGLVIDRIEDNVIKARDYVEVGAENIVMAHKFQKKARRKKICIILVVAILVGVLVTYLAITFL